MYMYTEYSIFYHSPEILNDHILYKGFREKKTDSLIRTHFNLFMRNFDILKSTRNWIEEEENSSFNVFMM